jgi:hypothetical protein
MKKHFLLCLLGLNIAACKKTGPAPDNASVAPNFAQEFTLYPQQQAHISGTGARKLTVTLTDLDFTYCPPNVNCFVGTFVSPKLSITDAQGQTQQLALPLTRVRSQNPAWIDTTTIRANGQRYLVYYHKWNIAPPPAGRNLQKKDISVTLRVTK